MRFTKFFKSCEDHMSKQLRRFNYWLHRRKIEEELAEEIELHRALKQKEFEKSGMHPEGATFASRRSLGNVLLAREDSRGVWIPRWFDELSQDIGYGLRQLRRNPGFTLIAVLTLAIGIGANSAVFTIVNSVLLEALPYKDPSRLVAIFEKLPNAPVKFGVSPPDYVFVHESARSYSGMAAYRTVSYELSGVAQPERLTGARIGPE